MPEAPSLSPALSPRRRAAIEHIQRARQRLMWAAEELSGDDAAYAAMLRLSITNETLRGDVLRLAADALERRPECPASKPSC